MVPIMISRSISSFFMMVSIAWSWSDLLRLPTRSTGLRLLQNSGRKVSSSFTRSSGRAARFTPSRSHASAATTPQPPPIVTTTTRSPLGSGSDEKAVARSMSSSEVSTGIIPACSTMPWYSSMEPAIAPE